MGVSAEGSSATGGSFSNKADVDYLQAQARAWLEAALGEVLPEDQSLPDALADGVILIRLAVLVRKLLKQEPAAAAAAAANGPERTLMRSLSVTNGGSYFAALANIDKFIKACRDCGLSDVTLFSPSDLLERKDLRRVYLCLRALSKKLPQLMDFDSASSLHHRGFGVDDQILSSSEPSRGEKTGRSKALGKSSYFEANEPCPSVRGSHSSNVASSSRHRGSTMEEGAIGNRGAAAASSAAAASAAARFHDALSALRDRDPSPSRVPNWVARHAAAAAAAVAARPMSPGACFRSDQSDTDESFRSSSLSRLDSFNSSDFFSHRHGATTAAHHHQRRRNGGGGLGGVPWDALAVGAAAALVGGAIVFSNRPARHSPSPFRDGRSNSGSNLGPIREQVPCTERPHLNMGKDGAFELNWSACDSARDSGHNARDLDTSLAEFGSDNALAAMAPWHSSRGTSGGDFASSPEGTSPLLPPASPPLRISPLTPTAASPNLERHERRLGTHLAPIRTRMNTTPVRERYEDLNREQPRRHVGDDKMTHVMKSAKVYEVKPGDTLATIARSFGKTWQEVSEKNPHIRNPNVIYPKDRLLL